MSASPKDSKFLSLILRHKPETIGLRLDQQGWADVQELIERMNAHGHRMDRAGLEEIVRTNAKQRFILSPDGQRIRANQGHSISVDLGYKPQSPPEYLYHGTASRFIKAIEGAGCIRRMERHHVHLSVDPSTARAVGQRHGRAVVLRVLAGQMERDGYAFLLSDNGVWLTDEVPLRYVEEDQGDG
ncbi:MAG: RNA 2'-phosphotransferase [Bacteroidetes bacterium]|nr:MAG: RNA 2'-phosphotransferase [Bacteroidota bacterium]